MPWARASGLQRHLVCPASASLPQFDRGVWRPGALDLVSPAQLTARVQTNLEREKQDGWGRSADWGTQMHAAKAGLPTLEPYTSLMRPHRDKLWPAKLGLHEVGVAFDCETREAFYFHGPSGDVDAWKVAQRRSCIVGSVDWWAELPSGEPWIDDLKTGKWVPDTVTPQTLFYVMVRSKGAQFASIPTARISVTHIPREEEPELTEELFPERRWKQVSRFTLEEFEEDCVRAYQRATEQEPRAVAGPDCEYCPSALVCPKGRE